VHVRVVTAAALGVLLGLAPALALAQQPQPQPQQGAPELRIPGDEKLPATAKPFAEDTRSGSLWLRFGGSLSAPLGRLAENLPLEDYLSTGPGLTFGVGVGIARHLTLDAEGSFMVAGVPERCAACVGQQLTGGLGLTYHVANALAVDLWGRIGAGVRAIDLANAGQVRVETTDGSPATSASLDGTYWGVDVVQLRLGGTFEPASGLAFGPWLGLDTGIIAAQPDAALLGHPAYVSLSLGLSLSLDPVRLGTGAALESETAAGSAPIEPANAARRSDQGSTPIPFAL
jgi:hypothetical protein